MDPNTETTTEKVLEVVDALIIYTRSGVDTAQEAGWHKLHTGSRLCVMMDVLSSILHNLLIVQRRAVFL